MNLVLRQIFALILLCLAVPGAFAVPAKDNSPEAEWRIKVRRDAEDNPHSTVDLVINGRQTVRLVSPDVVDNFQVMSPADYAGNKVPARALCACTSWWAGGGSRLYAVANARGDVEVYRMDLDEGDDSKPRWKRVRTIKVE